jgi:hypothetical protein
MTRKIAEDSKKSKLVIVEAQSDGATSEWLCHARKDKETSASPLPFADLGRQVFPSPRQAVFDIVLQE